MYKSLVGITILCALVGITVLCLMTASLVNVISHNIHLAQAKRHTYKPTELGAGSNNSTSLSSLTLNQSAIPSPKLSGNKAVMIGFDDSYKSQILYAKPILDQYGFKASFFEVCTWVGKTSERQTWQDIAATVWI